MSEEQAAENVVHLIVDNEQVGGPPRPPDDGDGDDGPLPVPYSDDALAARLSNDLSGNWRCAQPSGDWFRWDGARWAKDIIKGIFALARRTCRGASRELASDHLARKVASREKINAAVALAATDPRHATPIEAFDADIWRLNTPGGILYLLTGQLAPHDPAALLSKLTAASPEGECPRFRQFLREATGDDVELERYLQRVAGYCATGSVQEEVFFLLTGPGGTGKTKFQTVLEFVLGDYATTAPMDTFLTATGERHPTELAMFHGRRLVLAGETRKGQRFDEAKLKSITGGDTITARFMRQDFFSFRPQFKLLLAANRINLPKLQSADDAMRRRLQLVPFDHKPVKIDPELLEKLKSEAGGITRWVAEGAVQWYRQGLRPPPAVVKATDEYFARYDTPGRWAAERCERSATCSAALKRLYPDYVEWCGGEGETPVSKRTLSDALEGWEGLQKKRLGKAQDWGFVGIGLKPRKGELRFDAGRTTRGEPAIVPDWPGPEVADPAEDWPRE